MDLPLRNVSWRWARYSVPTHLVLQRLGGRFAIAAMVFHANRDGSISWRTRDCRFGLLLSRQPIRVALGRVGGSLVGACHVRSVSLLRLAPRKVWSEAGHAKHQLRRCVSRLAGL